MSGLLILGSVIALAAAEESSLPDCALGSAIPDHSAARPEAYPWETCDRLVQDYSLACARLEVAIRGLAALSADFQAHPDPDVSFARGREFDETLVRELVEENAIRKKLNRALSLARFTGLSATIRNPAGLARSPARGPVISHLMHYEALAKEMKRISEALAAATEREIASFQAIETSYRAAAARRRILACAGAVLAFGGLCWGARRRLGLGRGRPAQALPPGRVGALPLAPSLGPDLLVGRLIGEGGMGRVYEAIDKTMGRKVAVKQLRQEMLREPAALAAFLGEARLVARLRHPNIVGIHTVVHEEGRLLLVFEYVHGTTLHRLIDSRGRLGWPLAKHVLRGMAAGVDHAHQQRVIHRDLKPANVMLTDQGLVKVMDFGIAYQARNTVSRLTGAGSWGTPPYMAPEQELGQVSKSSDLFALAACFYQALTGELPFTGPNFLQQKREGIYAPASRHDGGLPGGIDEVLRRGLAFDPAGRFPSGADLVAAVERL